MVKEKGVILCALSGIKDANDVNTYVQQGVGAVLVGEALMRATDTRAFIRNLLSWPEADEKGKGKSAAPLVKICGIRTEEEALAAADAGADILGLMFVPTSKRHVSLETAQRIAAAIHAKRITRPPLAVADTPEPNEPWFTAHARRLSATLNNPDSPSRPLLSYRPQHRYLNRLVPEVCSHFCHSIS